MKNMYQVFFQLYGGIHIVAGVCIALWPSILHPVLVNELDQGAGVLIGIFSLMTGLGFYGAACIKEIQSQLLFVKLAFVANIANGFAHLFNSLTGSSPSYMAFVGLSGISILMIILAVIYRKLSYQKPKVP